MKLINTLLVLGLSTTTLFAQTKKIAHRNHSGSNTSYSVNGEGNYGNPRMDPPPPQKVDTAKAAPAKKPVKAKKTKKKNNPTPPPPPPKESSN